MLLAWILRGWGSIQEWAVFKSIRYAILGQWTLLTYMYAISFMDNDFERPWKWNKPWFWGDDVSENSSFRNWRLSILLTNYIFSHFQNWNMILINAISIPQVFRGTQILDLLTFIVLWFNSENFQKFLFMLRC